jgi:hypothetical protein
MKHGKPAGTETLGAADASNDVATQPRRFWLNQNRGSMFLF